MTNTLVTPGCYCPSADLPVFPQAGVWQAGREAGWGGGQAGGHGGEGPAGHSEDAQVNLLLLSYLNWEQISLNTEHCDFNYQQIEGNCLDGIS